MKSIISVLCLFFLCQSIFCQQDSQNYSRVKIDLSAHPIQSVAILGLECDHGIVRPGKHLINDFSSEEIKLLQQNGIPYEILIEDVVSYYKKQNIHTHNHELEDRNDDCDHEITYNYTTPENYKAGSMGGYLTYDELLVEVDKMHELYPSLISERFSIGDIKTHENRSIFWIRVSDNPSLEQDRPKALYTALHHAREPNSLSQMIFYLWYLLENYESDEEVKYLVDNTEMYFIPCVNPDGYIYNETTNPDGGGLWRKNRRVGANDEVHGVDLNRNYGYEWAYDDIGSSPDITSATYRGPAPFSEPETQAVKLLCETYNFQVCLNYHTSGNLLIYPWGYSQQETEDHPSFRSIADVMTNENKYLAGTGLETVGYNVNGISDDWMYGEELSKNKIFAMTPEVGKRDFGFWPPENQIDHLNKSTLRQNLLTAHVLLSYVSVKEENESEFLESYEGNLDFTLTMNGLQEGDVLLDVNSLSSGLTVDLEEDSWDLIHLQEESFLLNYTIDPDTPNGSELEFVFEVDMGLYSEFDTIRKIFLAEPIAAIFEENIESESEWNSTGVWGLTQSTYVSEDYSLTDSPNENYPPNYNAVIQLNEPIYIEESEIAYLNFYAKWDIETDWDYAQILISTDGNQFTPVCGKYTVKGTSTQDDGMPLYEGVQDEWVLEEIDLEDFMGENIYIQFKMVSDDLYQWDGIFIDNIAIYSNTSVTSIDPSAFTSLNLDLSPSPFEDQFKVIISGDLPSIGSLSIYNNLGQVVFEKDLQSLEDNFSIDGSAWSAGSYQVIVKNEAGQNIITRKLLKQ